jgi:hypothetical protein
MKVPPKFTRGNIKKSWEFQWLMCDGKVAERARQLAAKTAICCA